MPSRYSGRVSETTTAPASTTAPVDAPVIAPVETPVEGGFRSTPTAATTTASRTTPRKDDVARAYITGEAITALCGKKWVPTRDPTRYPICPTCVERKAAGWSL